MTITLTDDERRRGWVGIPNTRGRWYSEAQVEAILTARLAPIAALADDLAAIAARQSASHNVDTATGIRYAEDRLHTALTQENTP